MAQSTLYDLGFTSGSLLFKEARVFVDAIEDDQGFMDEIYDVKESVIPTNSEASRIRIARELRQRFRSFPSSDFLKLLREATDEDFKLILFYAVCRKYTLLADFMLELVRNKWLNLDYELDSRDFESYVYKKMDSHPELVELAKTTRDKLAQVALRMLNEVGILERGRLQKIDANTRILSKIVETGDLWFLDVLLLNDKEKNQLMDL
jgi:hypothetical protein